MYFPPVPSAPPTSVNVSDMTNSSITVQWGPVECIHRNGNITSYSVRHGVDGTRSYQTVNVSGGSTITGLNAATNYSIEVAAVNSAGIGEYSDPISSITLGENLLKYVA